MASLGKLGTVILLFVHLATAVLTRSKWNKLFKSDARVFPSDHEFSMAHKTLHSQIQNFKSLNTAKSKRKHHVYLSELKDCDTSCHMLFSEIVDRSKYWVRNSEVVQFAATPAIMDRIQSSELSANIVDVFPLHPKLKYDSSLTYSVANCAKTSQDGLFSYLISVVPLPSQDLQAFVEEVQRVLPVLFNPKEPLHANVNNALTVKCLCTDSAIVLDGLAGFSEVIWVYQLPVYAVNNRWAKGLVQSGTDNNFPIFAANLTGRGQVVGISDTGIDMNSCYFRDPDVPPPYDAINHTHRKVVTYIGYLDDFQDDTSTGHGTHVAGSVAGKSSQLYGTFSDYDGNAPDAKIAFMDIGRRNDDGRRVLIPPANLNEDLFQLLRDAGAYIMSNSWGSADVTNSYGAGAKYVDQFMYQFPDSLVLFSAGNDGLDYGMNSVLEPSTNKNGVSVGAGLNSNLAWRSYLPYSYKSVFHDDGVIDFSAVGPTSDLRLKPDIIAPGAPIYSAWSRGTPQCAAKSLQGTSMACPTAAGATALIRQYFVDGYYPSGERNANDSFIPSGSLMKAMLLHSGKKLNRRVFYNGSFYNLHDYPSINQGYGRVTLDNVLNFGPSEEAYASLFVRGGARPDDKYFVMLNATTPIHYYTILTHPEESSPLRVTMAYTDIPPGDSWTVAGVHVLTITVTDLDSAAHAGTVYTPLVAPFTSGNNVKMIDIPVAQLNTTYLITVEATFITEDQPYSLVVTGKVTKFVSTSNSTTNDVALDIESIGITTSLRVAMATLGAGCLALLIALYSIRRENSRIGRLVDKARKLQAPELFTDEDFFGADPDNPSTQNAVQRTAQRAPVPP